MSISLAFNIKMTIISMKIIGFYKLCFFVMNNFSLKEILLVATNRGSRSPCRICPANFTLDGLMACLNSKYFCRIYPICCVFTSMSPTKTNIWVNSCAKSNKSIKCSLRRPPSPLYFALKNLVHFNFKKMQQKIWNFLKSTRKFS